MANYQKEVSLFENPCLLLQRLVSTTGAGKVPTFAPAEQVRGIRTAEDIEMVQAILSPVCERITCSRSFQQTLPP